ncbi:MAG: ABC transporter permease [Sedimentisphaerales bacterium]|nr:ABC transporter permease [Sedimentisphaerales bacterium]
MASRRVRYYALRMLYAMAVTGLIMVTWSVTIRSGPAVLLASRMPEVAKTVTTAVTWLQFFAAQGLAVVLLSSAIGEEVRKGTLSALMTTPISSSQIVIGKLLGRMLQVLVLLAMSLPALAILRLLGGVPWRYVLAGGCITLTTALLAGALSLWLSSHCRYGSKTISAVLVVAAVVFIVPEAALSSLGSYRAVNVGAFLPILEVISPFRALYVATIELWTPRAVSTGAYAPWMLNSLVMMAVVVILMVLTAHRVRRVATEGVTGSGRSGRSASRTVKRILCGIDTKVGADGPVRHVKGPPVVWKETCRGLRYGWSLSDIVICVIALAVILIPIVVLDIVGLEPVVGVGLFVAWLLSVFVLFRLAVECAGNVPREREARTWPVLLTTLLEDKEIVYGKAKASLLRSSPLLITLVVIYALSLVVFPRAQTLMIAGLDLSSLAASVLLVVGIGSYFGVTIKTRASAIVATIAVCLAMKYAVGGMLFPMVAAVVAGADTGGKATWWILLAVMVGLAAIHAIIGVTAIRVAAQRVRHDVF